MYTPAKRVGSHSIFERPRDPGGAGQSLQGIPRESRRPYFFASFFRFT